MGIFDGKKLLVLGSNIASMDIVNYAKSEGAYVVVTDYLPTEQSEAKMIADETYMISTTDTDELVELVNKKRINGVFCGVSEINLKSVQNVTARTGLPCYFSMEQWELFENKAVFKSLCERYNVPVAKQFRLSVPPTEQELNKVDYPVIIKPVDLCASRGIHICYNKEELLSGYFDALEKSPSHNVIIEQYLFGDEISATYTFVNGICKLSMLSQMYYNLEQKGLVPLPDAYIYPSKYLDSFLISVNKPIINMLESTGINNGTVFISGIASNKGFAFFEAGFRIAGTAPYKFVSEINKINIMQLMTEYAVNGTIENPSIVLREDPTLKGKICCLYSLLNKGGKIAEISGIDEVCKIPGIIANTVQRKVGDTVLKDGTLGQINLRFYIIKDSITEICDIISQIQSTIEVKDDSGANMLLASNVIQLMKKGENCE